MTDEQADASMRTRWAHPPVDPHDVDERIAVRFGDDDRWQVQPAPPAVRLFLRRGDGWTSVYVHDWRDTDRAADELLRRVG